MIRLLLDTGNAPPTTGIGVYSAALFESLRAFAGTEILADVSVISSPKRSLRPLRRLEYLWKLAALRREGYNGAQVVHFTNVYVPKRRRDVAYVGTVHDIDALLFPDTYSKQYRAYFRHIINNIPSRADAILTVSHAARDTMLGNLSFPPERIAVIGNGLSKVFVSAIDRAPDQRDIDPPMVLFVGSLSVKKNTAWLIRQTTAGIRSGALRNLRLVLAGSAGYGFQEVRAALREANGIVQWVEHPTPDQLAILYKRSSAVVLPSRTEGFGIPLLEAMYCRRHLVASRIPASVEVSSPVAHFFDLDDTEEFYNALNAAIAKYPLSEETTRFMTEILRRYSWENLVTKYVNLYREVIS